MKWFKHMNLLCQERLAVRQKMVDGILGIHNPGIENGFKDDEFNILIGKIVLGDVWDPVYGVTYLALFYRYCYLDWTNRLGRFGQDFDDKVKPLLEELSPDILEKE